MEPTWGPPWVLSAPDGPHVVPMNFAIRDASLYWSNGVEKWYVSNHSIRGIPRGGQNRMADMLPAIFFNTFWTRCLAFWFKYHFNGVFQGPIDNKSTLGPGSLLGVKHYLNKWLLHVCARRRQCCSKYIPCLYYRQIKEKSLYIFRSNVCRVNIVCGK